MEQTTTPYLIVKGGQLYRFGQKISPNPIH